MEHGLEGRNVIRLYEICKTCGGDGHVSVMVDTAGPNSMEFDPEPVEITCIGCGGRGEIPLYEEMVRSNDHGEILVKIPPLT